MERGEAEQLLRDGLRRLLEENYELFAGEANERAITSQLAANMMGEPRVPDGLSVDHEYNRMGILYPKILQDWIDGELKLDDEGNPVERKRIPDILVHGRGDNDDNTMAVEVKVGTKNDKDDKSKIWALTSYPFDYQFGILLCLIEEGNGDSAVWMAHWAWNPEHGNPDIAYDRVFTEEEAGELTIKGRRSAQTRLTSRKSVRAAGQVE